MICTTQRKKKDRLTGYYWVHWAGMDDFKIERIGYYYAPWGKWRFPGDQRLYDDGDLLAISKYQIHRYYRVVLWINVLQWVFISIITLIAVIKLIISIIT